MEPPVDLGRLVAYKKSAVDLLRAMRSRADAALLPYHRQRFDWNVTQILNARAIDVVTQMFRITMRAMLPSSLTDALFELVAKRTPEALERAQARIAAEARETTRLIALYAYPQVPRAAGSTPWIIHEGMEVGAEFLFDHFGCAQARPICRFNTFPMALMLRLLPVETLRELHLRGLQVQSLARATGVDAAAAYVERVQAVLDEITRLLRHHTDLPTEYTSAHSNSDLHEMTGILTGMIPPEIAGMSLELDGHGDTTRVFHHWLVLRLAMDDPAVTLAECGQK